MIELKNITKYYGDFPAVTNISFKIEKGEIVGLLGPNGAGKSTTMKMITGFMPPTSGELSVGGNDIVTQSIEARRKIGYLPETVPLYTDMTVYSYIEYMGLLRGLNKKHIKSKVDNVIEICKLEDYRNSLISKLSKGFRQRVGISQAIIHEPEVLVLDEPTIGIDPNQVVETRQLIKNLSGEHTLILSSHILPEVSSICERVLIIHEGEIAASDTIKNLSSLMSGKNKIEADIIGSPQSIVTELEKFNGGDSVYTFSDDVKDFGTGNGRFCYYVKAKEGATNSYGFKNVTRIVMNFILTSLFYFPGLLHGLSSMNCYI